MDIALIKSLLTALAFALGVLNVLQMLQLFGKISLFRLPTRTLRRWHRLNGLAVLLTFGFVAFHCLKIWSLAPDTARIWLHAAFGTLGLFLIALKVTAVRWVPRLMDGIVWIGTALFVSTTGIFLTSAAYYFLVAFGILGGETPSYGS
jgi:hypothetical protein